MAQDELFFEKRGGALPQEVYRNRTIAHDNLLRILLWVDAHELTSHNHSTTGIQGFALYSPSERLPAGTAVTRIELPNAEAALAYQKNMLGAQLGPYDKMTNSCCAFRRS